MADYKSALSISYVKLFYTNVFSEIAVNLCICILLLL